MNQTDCNGFGQSLNDQGPDLERDARHAAGKAKPPP